MNISTGLSSLIQFILVLLDLFVLSLAALVLQDFCNKVDKFKESSSSSAIDCLEELKTGMEILKNSLSPYLFVIFSCQCLSLINAALNVLYVQDNLYFASLFYIFKSTWELYYVAHVLDETMESYRSLRTEIR